jgi:hypothetical protein
MDIGAAAAVAACPVRAFPDTPVSRFAGFA